MIWNYLPGLCCWNGQKYYTLATLYFREVHVKCSHSIIKLSFKKKHALPKHLWSWQICKTHMIIYTLWWQTMQWTVLVLNVKLVTHWLRISMSWCTDRLQNVPDISILLRAWTLMTVPFKHAVHIYTMFSDMVLNFITCQARPLPTVLPSPNQNTVAMLITPHKEYL